MEPEPVEPYEWRILTDRGYLMPAEGKLRFAQFNSKPEAVKALSDIEGDISLTLVTNFVR